MPLDRVWDDNKMDSRLSRLAALNKTLNPTHDLRGVFLPVGNCTSSPSKRVTPMKRLPKGFRRTTPIYAVFVPALAATSASAQNEAVRGALNQYVTCAKTAVVDEFFGHPKDSDQMLAERAISACKSEENAYFSILTAQLAVFGSPQEAVIEGQALGASHRAKLKQPLAPNK
jgi:hypothetical protein